MALGKFKEALKDFRIVSKRAPSDKDAKAKLDECAKIVRRIEFEKAIEVRKRYGTNAVDSVWLILVVVQHDDKKRSVADSLDVEAISK